MESTMFLFATSNVHKLNEIREMLPEGFQIVGLKEAGIDADIAESGSTFTENALLKARFAFRLKGGNVIADDSGLEVSALHGCPGVHSARYAGLPSSDEKNRQKLLTELSDITNRKARFVTIIALIYNKIEYIFEGVIDGEIATVEMGTGGFGYDPLFIPAGYDKTFAQMTPGEKNAISHRSRALHKAVAFLNSLQ